MVLRLQGRSAVRIVAVAVISLAIAVGIGVSIANRGPLPTMLAQKGIALLEKRLPVHVDLERAQFRGPLRLVLYNVSVAISGDTGLTQPISAQEVHLDFNLFSVLRRQHLAGLEGIQLIAPDIKMDYQRYLELTQPVKRTQTTPTPNAPSSDPNGEVKKPSPRKVAWPNMAVLVRDGRIELQGAGAPGPLRVDVAAYGVKKELKITRLELRRGAGTLQVSGALTHTGQLAGQVQMADWLVTDALNWYPVAKMQGRGTIAVQASLGGSLVRPSVAGQITVRGAKFILPGTTPVQHMSLQQAMARFERIASGWEIAELNITTPTGQLVGDGTIVGDRLKINLAATNLALPTDIPLVSTWGISGKAGFTGELAGTLHTPELNGKLDLRKGRIWNQPVDTASGLLRINSNRFQFDKVEIAKGSSRYHIQGAIADLGAVQPSLHVRLDSRKGRVEDLLAVLASPIDAKGQLDGSLTFGGPFDGIVTAGKVIVREASVMGEQLDWAQGAFRWGQGQLELDDIRGRLDKGQLQVAGKAALDGSSLRIDIDTDNWPIDKVAHLAQLAPNWQGAVSLTGSLRGNVDNPYFNGDVLAKNLRFGKANVQRIEGPISLDGGTLYTGGLSAQTSQGGTWQLNGKVRNVLLKPEFDLDLNVEDESLSALLAMGGYRIPAVLVDGDVHGSVALRGPVDDPEARLRLRLSERGIAMHDTLRIDLRIADRRVSIVNAGV